MTLTQREALVALLQEKTIYIYDCYYKLNSAGELVVLDTCDLKWRKSALLDGCVIIAETAWELSFEDALACMREGRICRCEIAPEFNFWMNDKKRIVAGESTARLGPKANGHIVELCDDHFTAKWKVV